MFKVVKKFLCFSKPRQRAQSSTAKVKPTDVYPCAICDLRFNTESLYRYHIKSHTNSTKPPVSLTDDKLATETTENKTSGTKINGSTLLRKSVDLNLSKARVSDLSNASFGKSNHLNISRRSSGIHVYFKSTAPHSRWTKMVFEEAKLDEMVENLKKKAPRQRREAELKFVTSNRKGKSNITYGINEEWIEKYENFLNGKSRDLPGPIDNQPLKDKLKLRSASQHSYAVNELVWRFLLKLYGGGPEVIYKEKSGSLVMNDLDKLSDNFTNDTFARSIKSEVLESMRNSLVDLERTMKFDSGNPLRPMRMPNKQFYCYMNSCLQALLGIPEFVNYIAEHKYKPLLKASDPKFWPAVAEAVSAYTSGETYFTPDSIRMLTRDQFNPNEQHDAHEFMTFLMSGLQDEVNLKQPQAEITHKDGFSAWNHYRKYNISLIDELFAGQLASSIECSKCHNVSTTYDPFLDLSLPLVSEKTLTLDDCLANFQNEDEVIDSYVCEKCKTNGKAVKRLRIDRFPKLLVVQFKRFQTYPKKEKIQDYVGFPVGKWEIKAAPESQREAQNYFLKAVICHIGPIDSGHYVCFSKRGDEWYFCDDERYGRILPQDICNGEAYVLIYGQEE